MSHPEMLFEGKRFRVVRLRQLMPDGTEHFREIVRHPGAVVILPLLDDGRIYFVQNYRVAVDETLVELPAGTLEPGEDPAETARRELAEETGCGAGRLEHLISFYTSPGILDEQMHFYLATALQQGAAAPEAGEDLQPLITTWEEALDMVRHGGIKDAKTIAALLYYAEFVRGS